MAILYEILGQVSPAAGTTATLYTVPAATQAVCSTLAICNTSNTSTTYHVQARIGGASTTTAQYIVFNSPVSANDSIFLTVGMSLSATDVVSVFSAGVGVAFNLFGSEIT
jgi:hypothetical protein